MSMRLSGAQQQQQQRRSEAQRRTQQLPPAQTNVEAELIRRVEQLEEENILLREQLESSSKSSNQKEKEASGRGSRVNPMTLKPKYDVSLSVLVLEKGRANTVHLNTILDKSYLREDDRDADTPVAGAGFEYGRFSTGSLGQLEGRLSEYSIGGGSAEGSSPDMRYSFGSPQGTASSSDLNSGTGGFGDPARNNNRPKVGRLDIGGVQNRPASLDPDAIVSNHTLQEFNRMYAQAGAQTPMCNHAESIRKYLLDVFVKNGFQHSQRDKEGFGRTLGYLCRDVETRLKNESRHVEVASPSYVFGDIHGNFRDLQYFMSELVLFDDMRYTPHSFVFLGDYVDRGEFSVETVALLFCLKALAPEKVVLLRGNHEDTLVSGDMGSYGSTSFRSQCHDLFGQILGEEVWKTASRTFSYLPLTANIDKKIFCTHGGLPRYTGGHDDRMEMLKRSDFPVYESFFAIPPDESREDMKMRQIATDTCWSDPADNDAPLDQYGFGANPRGNGVILFGSKAVDQFLDTYGFEYIFRAHQEKSDGLKLSKSARVFTIFSTSAYVGHSNGAGVVLVADGKIRLIIKNAPTDDED